MARQRSDEQNENEKIKEEAAYWDRKARQLSREADFFGIWGDREINDIFYGDILKSCYERAYACGGRMLELGCGEGDDAIKLAARGNTVDAIDLSRESLKKAQASYREAGERQPGLGTINFIVGDMNSIALQENRYHCVFAKSSLYLAVRLKPLMAAIQRALKPGGSLIVLDSVGMKKAVTLLTKSLVLILPTTRSYRDKIRARGKFATVQALTSPGLPERTTTAFGTAFAWKSPLTSFSRKRRLAAEIGAYFAISDIRYYHFIAHYVLPRLRLRRGTKVALCKTFRRIESSIVGVFPGLGEFMRIVAINNK